MGLHLHAARTVAHLDLHVQSQAAVIQPSQTYVSVQACPASLFAERDFPGTGDRYSSGAYEDAAIDSGLPAARVCLLQSDSIDSRPASSIPCPAGKQLKFASGLSGVTWVGLPGLHGGKHW